MQTDGPCSGMDHEDEKKKKKNADPTYFKEDEGEGLIAYS